MSDRLNHTQRHSQAEAAPARPRPQGRPQPPLALLQAAAGNRAVTSAIRRGSGTAIQRAVGTAQLPRGTVVARATSAPVDDLQITPVTECQRPGGATGRGADGATEQQAAVDEVADQKAKAKTASLERADAETDVWKASGEAAEARGKAAAARGRAEKLERAAGVAEQSRTNSLTDEEGFMVTAATALEEQQTAEVRAGGLQGTESRQRAAAIATRAEERKYTEQAEQAEEKREAAEVRAAGFEEQATEAERKQKVAEAEVARLKKQAKTAKEQQEAAETAARAKAEAEDQAQQRAAKAEAEAEAEDKIAKSVKKWAEEAAKALKEAGAAMEEARRQKGEFKAAGEARNEAKEEASTCAEDRDTAQEQAETARRLATRQEKEADVAAQERGKAEREAARHKEAVDKALGQADRAQTVADTQERIATEQRRRAAAARADEQTHASDATEAQNRAAVAGQKQLDQRAAQTTATTALREAKKTREVEKKPTEAAAEAAKKSAAETAEAAKKSAAETAEQTGGAEPAGTGKVRGTRRKRARDAAGKGIAKVKAWADVPDVPALRLSAPYNGTQRAEATSHGDMGTVQDTAAGGLAEAVPNATADFTGTLDNTKALKNSYKKRNETGPASHEHRKNLRTKFNGALTAGLMLVNDLVKGVANIGRVTENAAGVAELGAASGGLTMAFSALTFGRDIKAFKDTRAQREELKTHFSGVVAKRGRDLEVVLGKLGAANTKLAQDSVSLAAAGPGAEAEAQRAVEADRTEIGLLRQELMEHLASGRDYAVKKKKRKLRRRAINGGGNIARTAAGAVGVAAAAGAVSGGIGAGVVGGTTAVALGEVAVEKGLRKANKRYASVRDYQKHARTTPAQEGTPEPEAPRLDKDGRGRKSDALKEAVMVTHPIKQGKRPLNAQKLYAQAAGPAVPVGENVPEDIRLQARDFLKALKCSPVKHNQKEEQWLESLNDPDKQTEWEEAIAKALSSL